jgi:hypothetical protein
MSRTYKHAPRWVKHSRLPRVAQHDHRNQPCDLPDPSKQDVHGRSWDSFRCTWEPAAAYTPSMFCNCGICGAPYGAGSKAQRRRRARRVVAQQTRAAAAVEGDVMSPRPLF